MRRVHGETTGSAFVGWDKQATQKPIAFMMMTTLAAVFVVKLGAQRQLAQPLSMVQQHDLTAVGVSTTYFTATHRGYRDKEGQSRSRKPRRQGYAV